ncbi:hypothetical protein [Lysinibacter sp. HNR]|uniref:hypothetical protein n=1 Tax=Lysinibacter sp. HNR TaxID=3031408 RepID=UPI002434A09F|nr:hypothetical protein [Lysinibacter sp. HNR]WGD37754.1 hypothetical protein FrondiHNR_02240 [Lysinibacter sp. HNR]
MVFALGLSTPPASANSPEEASVDLTDPDKVLESFFPDERLGESQAEWLSGDTNNETKVAVEVSQDADDNFNIVPQSPPLQETNFSAETIISEEARLLTFSVSDYDDHVKADSEIQALIANDGKGAQYIEPHNQGMRILNVVTEKPGVDYVEWNLSTDSGSFPVVEMNEDGSAWVRDHNGEPLGTISSPWALR